MLARLGPEEFVVKVGRAVDHRELALEPGRGVNHAVYLDHLADTIEAPELRAHRGEDIERRRARSDTTTAPPASTPSSSSSMMVTKRGR